MKRSEMLDHMYQDIIEALASRASSNETDEKYWRRKVEGLLDMQLGFGMLPPTLTGEVELESHEDGLAIKLWGWEDEA